MLTLDLSREINTL